MPELDTFEDVLDLAISREVAAWTFYEDMADQTVRPAMVEVFRKLAAEERGHEARLRRVKADPATLTTRRRPVELSMSDYIVGVEPSPDMTYEDAIVLAMKREEVAHRLYTDLATQTSDPALVDLFQALAAEEGRHKHRFEVEYDEYVLTQN